MTAQTLARDADGRVALTTEQAAAFTEWMLSPGIHLPEDHVVNAVIRAHPGEPHNPYIALARWVLRWVPVVSAAEALEGAADGFADLSPWSADDAVPRGWDAAVDKVVAAVREARAKKAEV